MIDIYSYKDAKYIKIVDIDNKTYIGSLVSVNAAEDEYEGVGLSEDSITLAIDGIPITFPVSEIKEATILHSKKIKHHLKKQNSSCKVYVSNENETPEDLLLTLSDFPKEYISKINKKYT